MLEKVLQLLFITCRHGRTSQPFTASTAAATSPSAPWDPVGLGASLYVVCLECGKEFSYDWNAMRIDKLAPEVIDNATSANGAAVRNLAG